MNIPQERVFGYWAAFAFVGVALFLSLALQHVIHDGFLIFFLIAVMLAGWFGRTGPGLFAVALSMVAADYFFIAPYGAFIVEVEELPYLLAFLSSAVLTSWLGAARRTAEEKQRAHLDELFEQTPEAIMLVDLQDRVLRVNREFTNIFGYRIDEIIGSASTDLITPPQLRPDALTRRKRLAEGQHVSLETVCLRKDGSQLSVSEVSFPVMAGGKCIAHYVIFRDITEGKRAIEELEKARAELAHLSRITTMGELAASIAHEINQPIGAIAANGSAAARWLGQAPPDIKEAEEALGCIVRDANRAADVIRRIRSLLRKKPAPMVRLDVNDVIRDVVMLTELEARRRRVDVAIELTPDLPSVLGDRVQLQQVLLNLLINGFDAIDGVANRPRQIMIKSARVPGCVVIQVHDSGHGLDEQHEMSIFDPFFTTKKDGIGMGLTISRSIIEAHGGTLWAERGTPHGAILKFTIPMAGMPE
jgi:PAS domain S-box-containing protein